MLLKITLEITSAWLKKPILINFFNVWNNCTTLIARSLVFYFSHVKESLSFIQKLWTRVTLKCDLICILYTILLVYNSITSKEIFWLFGALMSAIHLNNYKYIIVNAQSEAQITYSHSLSPRALLILIISIFTNQHLHPHLIHYNKYLAIRMLLHGMGWEKVHRNIPTVKFRQLITSALPGFCHSW